MEFKNWILMVTEDAQKLRCDSEVFWGNCLLCLGSGTSWLLKEKREATGRVTEARSPAHLSLQDIQSQFLVFSSFLPCERNESVWKVLGMNYF